MTAGVTLSVNSSALPLVYSTDLQLHSDDYAVVHTEDGNILVFIWKSI